MPRQTITPLSMSQTKEELLRHLGMSTEIYDLMALETANTYAWLTRDFENFKTNSSRTPPFDWSDITELAKQNAALSLSQSPDHRTSPYWQMGGSPSNDNNWVAIWFLYHKFRYRDGRNRAKDSKKGTKKHHKSGSDGKKSSTKSSSSYQSFNSSLSQSPPSATSLEVAAQQVYYEQTSAPVAYDTTEYAQPVVQYGSSPVASKPFYDPARNKFMTGH